MSTTLAAAALPLLLDAALQGTVVLLLAFVLARFMRRASAGSRHLVWAFTMIALVGVPLLSYLLPSWQVSLTIPGLESARSSGKANLKDFLFVHEESTKHMPALLLAGINKENPGQMLEASRDTTSPIAMPAKERATSLPAGVSPEPIATWIVLLWFAGAVLAVIWLFGGWLSLVRLARNCERISAGLLHQLLADVAQHLGIRRPVVLLLSVQRTIPMTWSLWRPVVLLPQEAQNWTATRLRMVLTHELGHVQRWDCLVQMLAHLARGVYWFNPLVWLAVRQLRIEQEHACDDLVLDSGMSAPDYAEHLLAVTAGLPPGFWTAPVALGMGRANQLRHRLIALLDAGRSHRPVPRRTLFWAAAISLALVIPLGTVALPRTPTAAHAEEPKSHVEQATSEKDSALIRKLTEVRDKLAKHYVVPLDEKKLAEQVLNGLLQGLKDPYTDYLSAEDLNSVDNQIQGKLTGVGAQLQMVNDRLTVTTPLEGSPALKAGLRPGDTIEIIDGKSTRGLALNDALQRISGKAGTVVKLKVVHPEGVVVELPITRGEVRLRTVTGFRRGPDGQWQFFLNADHKIGYVNVRQFARSTSSEVRGAIDALQKEGLKGLILDLRFCPGGLLDQALEVCKLFLTKGVIVTIRGPAKEETVFKADGKGTLGDFPLVVLINDNTASAAEIVAGALRDHERAILLGTRSFGKGSVQSLVKLDEGGALKITTAYHYLPSGRNIQKRPGEKTWGVDPSDGFYLPLTAAQTEALRKDAQKRALLEVRKEGQPKSPRFTPKMIEENHVDLQLAAALRSLVARLTGGEFLKVGKDNGLFLDQALRLEEMRERREKLLQNMNELEREMAELQHVVGKEKAPAK